MEVIRRESRQTTKDLLPGMTESYGADPGAATTTACELVSATATTRMARTATSVSVLLRTVSFGFFKLEKNGI